MQIGQLATSDRPYSLPAFVRIPKRRVRHLRDVPRDTNLFVYNTESGRPVHEAPVPQWNYYFSEYFGPDIAGETLVGKVHHQDLMHLSLAIESVDIALSSDVLEHVVSPYKLTNKSSGCSKGEVGTFSLSRLTTRRSWTNKKLFCRKTTP